MPQIQTFDFTPQKQEPTGLEKTLSAFSGRQTENRTKNEESDALKDIYQQYQNEGQDIDQALMSLGTDTRIGPTAKVNEANKLLEIKKANATKLEKTNKLLEENLKLEKNKQIIADIEKRRELEPGSLSAYENDPKMAEQVTRPPKEGKKTQASQPIDPDQLKRIQHVRTKPEFEAASPAKKYQMLTDSGVSKENADAEVKFYVEEGKIDKVRDEVIAEAQAKKDVSFVNEQVEAIPKLETRERTLDEAAKLNEKEVTGNAWDLAMQNAGLLQYTSEGFREFASHAKDAVKNQNIKSVIGSQISQMEFGFFRDATISERFSKEANEQIIKKEKLAIRYEKLYADITKKVVQDNGGRIPPNIQGKVNEEFAIQSQKISKEVAKTARDFNAIQHVPEGKVLMFDKNRRPLHVPEADVAKLKAQGASLK